MIKIIFKPAEQSIWRPLHEFVPGDIVTSKTVGDIFMVLGSGRVQFLSRSDGTAVNSTYNVHDYSNLTFRNLEAKLEITR